MARSIKSCAITFGMVAIPVKLYSATVDQDLSFNQLHAADNSRVKYKKVCAVDDVELSPDEIIRAYEVSKGNYVQITDADLEQLPLPSKDTINLDTFVSASEVDPVYFERAYWLEPEAVGVKPYFMLLRALTTKNVVGVAKITLKTKEALCCLRPSDGLIQLNTLYWPDELRALGTPLPKVAASPAELQMAEQLVEAYTEPFNPSKYHDQYREALLELIAAKSEGRTLPVAEAPQTTKEPDLMGAFQAMLAAKQAQKGAA